MGRVIVPTINVVSNCEAPKCESCELERAKLKKSKVIKSKEAKYLEGAISRNKYQIGDFVSMDQYIVKTTYSLHAGYGRYFESSRYVSQRNSIL